MSDLRDKINLKKQADFYLEESIYKKRRSFSPLPTSDVPFELDERRSTRSCSRDGKGSLQKGDRSLFAGDVVKDGRLYNYRRRVGYEGGCSSTQRMASYDDDIARNYTNKVIEASRSYKIIDVWEEGRRREEYLASRKIHHMAREIKVLQENVKLSREENNILEDKLKDAHIQLDDVNEKLKTKEDALKHCEQELFFSRGKVEKERVFVEDLTFENKNNKEYISDLEKEVKELKEIKVQLGTENTQIRQLAKEISDDSDNLLKVIKELKAEKKITDEKVVFLEKSISEKDELLKVNEVNSNSELKVNVTQEEVNEVLLPLNRDQDQEYVILDQV